MKICLASVCSRIKNKNKITAAEATTNISSAHFHNAFQRYQKNQIIIKGYMLWWAHACILFICIYIIWYLFYVKQYSLWNWVFFIVLLLTIQLSTFRFAFFFFKFFFSSVLLNYINRKSLVSFFFYFRDEE